MRERDVKEPCVIVAAMRDASGLCVMPLIDPSRRAFGPPQDEGMARRKAQTCGVRVSFWESRRAPLGAPHALK
jgi:hypothetical protein